MAKTTIKVRGDEVTVDPSVLEEWAAFEAMAALESDQVSSMGKAQATFDLAELVSGLTKDDIVGRCGGPTAKTADVIGYALEVIQGATPKN